MGKTKQYTRKQLNKKRTLSKSEVKNRNKKHRRLERLLADTRVDNILEGCGEYR